MKKLILDYAKQNPKFDKSLETLKERYKTNDVSDEVVADVCGELFGNREFIQSVVEKKPNIFKKILNNIRKLSEKIKGTGTNEYVSFVEKLKTMWEDAYYSNKSNLSRTMHHLSKEALNEVNDALNNPNTDINSMVKLRDFTPEQLVSVGVSDLPMLVRKGHLRENILTSSEAENKGYSTKGKHYHGLGIETYMNAIDSLDNPIAVYQYTDKGKYSKDNFIVLTEIKDSDNNNIIVPIEIHKKGQYNKVEIDINKIKTTYGKNNSNYFDNMIKNGSLVEIYNKKRSAKLPIQSGNFNTSVANNIPQSNNNVNSDTSSTKYSMQINKNNTQELDNSSFSYTEIIRKSINDSINDVGENGRFDYEEENNDILWDKIYSNTEKNLGRKLTDEDYDIIDEKIEEFAKDGFYVADGSYSLDEYSNVVNKKLDKVESKLEDRGFTVEESHSQYTGLVSSRYFEKNGITIRIGDHNNGRGGEVLTREELWNMSVEELVDFVDKQYESKINTKYSQNTNDWNNYLKQNFISSGTKTKMSDIKLPIRNDINNQNNIKNKVTRILQRKSYTAIQNATSIGQKYLGFKNKEKKNFKEKLNKYYGMKKEELMNPLVYNEIGKLVSNYANMETRYIDEELKDLKKEIRNYNIKITDNLKNQITDYNNFRKSNFGKLKLVNEGQYVDEVYQELSDKYPHYFDKNILSESDMLNKIVDVINQDINIVDTYKLSESELKEATSKIYNSLLNKTMNETEINELQKELEDKVKRRTRLVVQEELLKEMNITLDDISVGKDINYISYLRTDPIRLNEKVFGAKIGKKINDEDYDTINEKINKKTLK